MPSGKLLAWWVPVKAGAGTQLSPGYSDIARRTRKVGDREVMEILVVNDIYNVTGGYLTKAESGTDQQGPALRELHVQQRPAASCSAS